MRRLTVWFGFGLLLVLLGACQQTGQMLCNESGALFMDDFAEGRNCGWALYDNGGSAEVVNEALVLASSQPGQMWWTNPGRGFDDVIIAVDTTQLGGPDDNAYGVICRYQSTQNFYVFLISGDGYYAIGKFQSGTNQIVYLSGNGQYQESEAINKGQAPNQIQASCVGNELSLAINGVAVDSVVDSSFDTGDIGLTASTFQPGALSVQFDNVVVATPAVAGE